MRPNVNSGCCTLENAASLAPIHNSPPYPLPPPTSHLHAHLHQQQQQSFQQQNHHLRHQQNFQQQQQHQGYNPQGPNPWLTHHKSLINASVQHQTVANKNGIGRHQSLQKPHLRMPPAHQQNQYQQYLGNMQPQPQHQPSYNSHHINGYTTANPPRSVPEQLSIASSTTSQVVHPHNFTKLPASSMVNQKLIHECAGIPLISNASTHMTAAQRQRVQHKLSSSPAPHLCSGDGGVEPSYHLHHSGGVYLGQNSSTASCTQISQLVVHAQGVPLLLHKQHQKQLQPQQSVGQNWSMWKKGSNAFQSAEVVKPTGKPIRNTLRFQHSAPAALNTRGKENNTVPTEEHATSDTFKDNVEGGDTALPRIIKPRKRRKKDRKPINNGIFLKLDALSNAGSNTTEKDSNKSGQTIGGKTTSQTELIQSQPQQVQLQSHWYSHNDDNENLYKFINFYIDNAQTMNCAASENAINSKSACQVYKPRGLLQLPCLKSLVVVNATKNTQDEHDLCFCHNCDPLRLIWDYPLRRSLSDSSTTSARTHSSTSSSSSSSSISLSPSHASSAEASASSTSPSTPLADLALSPTSALSRANRVGVIGSNRNVLDSNRDATNRMCNVFGAKTNANGCLSDSNDSGYGDILTGINIADDLFSQGAYNNTAAIPMPPLFDTTELMLNVNPFQTKTSKLYNSGDNSLLPLLPATADALLTESINEISRKLIETCGSELPGELALSTTRSKSAVSRCSSDLSADSGIDSAAIVNCDDLVFKFDNLSFNLDTAQKNNSYTNNNKENNDSNISTTTLERDVTNTFSNLLQLPTITSSATAPKTGTPTSSNEESLLIDAANINLRFDVHNIGKNSIFEFESENKRSEAVQENHQQQQQHNQQFINNCFDLV